METDEGKTYEGKVVSKIKPVKVTNMDVPVEGEDTFPTSVPEIWKEFTALKKRVEKLENIWFIKLFLG